MPALYSYDTALLLNGLGLTGSSWSLARLSEQSEPESTEAGKFAKIHEAERCEIFVDPLHEEEEKEDTEDTGEQVDDALEDEEILPYTGLSTASASCGLFNVTCDTGILGLAVVFDVPEKETLGYGGNCNFLNVLSIW